MKNSFDLVIVGGGLGGSVLAKSMAQRGASVLVLEREREFKDRVRGEFITSWGTAEGQRLGIYELLLDKVAHPVRWADFYAVKTLIVHRDVVTTTPQQLPCLAFYHPTMQEVVLQAASDAGAQVRRGVTVRKVRPGRPARVTLEENGRVDEVTARLVVGADGRSSTVRSSAGFEMKRDADFNLLAGVLMDDVRAPEDTAQLVTNSELGQQAVIFPQGRGRARTYFCCHTSQPRHQGIGDLARYVENCKRVGMNSEFYDGAKAAGPLATFDGAETWVEHPYRDGVVLVGDAAAASDPSWGQGLGMTLRDVRVLRDQLIASEDWDTAGHAYATEHDRHASVTHTANTWFSRLYLETGPEADARRARALPLIGQDPTRQPDTIFSGPGISLNEAVRKRFFAED
jgi:2-polyprenyl-6-methoxyphenol hydroxylase-like FAD-dependent oxidoreductase